MNKKAIALVIFTLVTGFLIGIVYATTYTDTIDTSLPAGDDDPAEADDNMRRIQGGYQEILAVEHNVDLTGTVITGDGTHTAITCDSVTSAGAISGTNISASGTLDVTGNIDPTSYETTNGGFLDEDDMASDDANAVASQQSVKAYVDATARFGVWNDRDGDGSPDTVSNNTVYQAATDGFAVAIATTTSANLKIFTDGSNPPTTVRADCRVVSNPDDAASATMPVRKDDYWKTTEADTVYWLPK